MGEQGADILGKKITRLLERFSEKTKLTVGWITIDDSDFIRVKLNVDEFQEGIPGTRSYVLKDNEFDIRKNNGSYVSEGLSWLERHLTNLYQRYCNLYPSSTFYIPRQFQVSITEEGKINYKVEV